MRTVKTLATGLPPVYNITASSITRVAHFRFSSATVNDGGTGYLVGDVLTAATTLTAPVTAATFTVTKVTPAGAVQEVKITNPGDHTTSVFAAPNSATGGTGSGVKLDLTATYFAVVTVTAARAHRLAVGQSIMVSVASSETVAKQRLYAGRFTVATAADAVTFAYEHPDSATTALSSSGSLTAQALVAPAFYDPFAAVRNNRLQVEDAVPDYSLHVASGDAAAKTGNWREILALENSSLTALTSSTLSNGAGMKIPAGTRIKGVFTSVTLGTGSVLLSE